MQLNLINIQKDRITIEPDDVLSLLGSSGNEDDTHSIDLITRYTLECIRICSPRGGFAQFKAEKSDSNEEIEIEGTRFRTGRIIRNMLKGSEEYAFFAVTAGPEPETLSKTLMNEGQFLEGYIVDLIATGIVESVADQAQEVIESTARKDGFKITNRYSPGYCTWDVAEQQKLFGLLPGECLGITLSESSLMLPIKSVSGIIGIGKDVKYSEYSCKHCSMKQCVFRRVDRRNPGFFIHRNRWSSQS